MNRLAETGLAETGLADRPALEAVGRVLTAIAGSGFELQPALDQIAKEARVLCAADAAFCFLLDGDHFRFAAADGGTPEHWAYEREHPDPIDDSSVNGRVALTGGAVQVEDLAEDPRYRAAALRIGGFRTLLGVPMGQGEEFMGTFGLGRHDVRPFTPEEIALVSVFADQAAVAVRLGRLVAAGRQAEDRDQSLGAVLASIARASFDIEDVLSSVIAEAVRLTHADTGNIAVRDGDVYRIRAVAGFGAEYDQAVRAHRYEPNRGSIVGRTLLERSVVEIPDVLADPDYALLDLQKIGQYRTGLGVPIWSDDDIIGVVAMGRNEVHPYSPGEIEIVKAFADQVAVALRLASLFGVAQEAAERDAAVGEVLQALARSTLDLDGILKAVLDNAVRLARATDGNIVRADDQSWRLAAVTAGVPEDLRSILEARDFTEDHGSAMGRALIELGPVHIADVLDDPGYTMRDAQALVGFRTILGIPLVSEGVALGVLSVWRREVQPFSDAEIRLVMTFADQAAVAIRLARQLAETTESLERESAVSQVLQSMARSTVDLDHLFQSAIERATALSHADEGNVLRGEEGNRFRVAAFTPGVPEAFREALEGYVFEPGRGTLTGRVLMERGPVQIPDVLADEDYEFEAAPRTSGARTLLGVPLLLDGEPIGVLAVWRMDVKPFTDLEIGVVVTFADQIGIAVKLVSLLSETTESLERESAVSQVLASIARSSFDLPSVLSAVTESAARLTGADSGNLAVIDGEEYRIAAAYGERSAELKRIFEASRITLNRGSMAGRVTLERRTVQIPDVLADPEYQQLQMQEVVGFRTLLGVPLMRDGTVAGVLMMQRTTVRPFTEQEIGLVETFADQAALAIANVELYETVERQRADLASFAPHVAGLLSSPEGEALLTGHRREISALFCDMRGFTAFAETAEPEELFSVLREYHAEVGRIALSNGGTVEHFAGDGFMIFFNDPTPVADHPLAATRAALAMHERFAQLAEGWHRRGYDLGLGIGISVGYATLGRIGFEGRYDYAGVGAVTNLAARLSSAAAAGETLLSQRAYAAVEGKVDAEPTDELALKGFTHAVIAYRVTALRPDA